MTDALGGVESTNTASDQMIDQFLTRLRGMEKTDVSYLMWIRRYLSWQEQPAPAEIYALLGQRMLGAGSPLMAYDVLAQGLDAWPEHVRSRQLMALALARSGATERANTLLRRLQLEEHSDAETLGILARTHKDLWQHSTATNDKKRELTQSHEIYNQAYQAAMAQNDLDGTVYDGINAASTALLMGRKEAAREIAISVREGCHRKLKLSDDYWATATLGEAAVILGEADEAETWYRKAAELGKGNFGDLNSTRHNARLLSACLGDDAGRYDSCFGMPAVVVLSSFVQGAGLFSLRLSQHLREKLMEAVSALLAEREDSIVYAAGTGEIDILFLAEAMKRGFEINVVLPFPMSEFRKRKSRLFENEDGWREFERIVGGAARAVVAGEHRVSTGRMALEYAARMRDGLARLRARLLDVDVIPVVLAGMGEAGAGEMPKTAGIAPKVIDVASLAGDSAAFEQALETGALAEEAVPPGYSQEIMAMLFSDVRGYSQLSEEQTPLFSEHFMGEVAKVASGLARQPVVKNSWGDALYFVFERVSDAGLFALALMDHVSAQDWGSKDLPADLTMRMALHAGPVYACRDPVTENDNCVGWHVTRVARIEPVTPPGQVYASEAFAALAAVEGVDGFACDYVGETALAKGFGTFPTYHLRRA